MGEAGVSPGWEEGERGKKEPEFINPNEAAWPLGLCR